jgi:thioredoxin reductase
LRSPLPKLAILGAGPIGLEAAVYAACLGMPYTVYEQGSIAEFLGRWGFLKLYTPFRLNRTELGVRWLKQHNPSQILPRDGDFITGNEYRQQYLTPLAASLGLDTHFKLQTTVLSIGRQPIKVHGHGQKNSPFRLLLRSQLTETLDTADIILDCTGTYARPNWLGGCGIPAIGELASRQHIPYWLDDILGAKKQHYAGKSILLIGQGIAAATAVAHLMQLAEEHPATWVTWLASTQRTQPIQRLANDPLRERDRLAVRANMLATRCDGNLEYHGGAVIEEVHATGTDKDVSVLAKVSTGLRRFTAERLLALVGYKADTNMTTELHLNSSNADYRTSEPGYYVLGQKSHARQSGFLIQHGHEQIRQVFAEILGQAKLNLHAA